MVAPIVVGTPTKFESATSGTTIPLAKPTGVQDGDMLVAVLRTNGSNSPADFALAGWTRRGYSFIANDAAGRVTGVYTRPVTDAASEPATYTFTKGVADTRRVGVMFVARGVDLTNPIVGNSINWDAQSPPRVQLNSFATDTTDEALLLYAWATEIVSPNATEPTIVPGTQIALAASSTGTGATRSTLWVGAETIAANPTGHKNLTWSSSAGAAATGVVLRGLAATPEPPKPKPGFSSVAHMLATPGATWAHRGGSTTWPEMSRYAYEQAVLAGYGALEFSANRTSDGVWIGTHDASLNRTSQTTGLPDISTMTWVQVQAYQNTLNSAGTPRPYFRLDEFLDTFTSTHVAIVDPKHAIGAYDTEFLNLLDAHGGPSKIVVKFFGVGSGAGALADKATARGYQTWGYFYAADVTSGDLAAWQSRWSILGMNWDAPQSAWDAVLAYGKPVVGHIVSTQAQYDTAILRGARMVQCAGVAVIRAVGASSIATLSLPTLGAQATGSVVPPTFAGSAASGLPSIEQAASGGSTAPVSTGTITAALGALASAGSGATIAPVSTGEAGVALPALTASAQGSATTPEQAGTVTSVTPALTSAGAGTAEPPEYGGAVDLAFPSLTSTANGAADPPPGAAGTIATSLSALTTASAGIVEGDAVVPPTPAVRTLTPLLEERTLIPVLTIRTLEEA